MHRNPTEAVAADEDGTTETFYEAAFACNANHPLMVPDQRTFPESYLLSSLRDGSEPNHHTVVHSDA